MARIVKFLLLLMPILEIVSLLLVGEEIGVVPTLLLLLAGLVIGIAVIRFLSATALQNFQRDVAQGTPPLQALQTSAATLGAGVLFIIPGFVTDVFAILLLMRVGYLFLRRRRQVDSGPMGNASAGMPGTAKIVDADFVIVDKIPHPDGSPKREAP
jgi:UPF0716 family protein affecting phage T7 exclusion